MTAVLTKDDNPWAPCDACGHAEDAHDTPDGSCAACNCPAFIKIGGGDSDAEGPAPSTP